MLTWQMQNEQKEKLTIKIDVRLKHFHKSLLKPRSNDMVPNTDRTIIKRDPYTAVYCDNTVQWRSQEFLNYGPFTS